MSWETCDVSEWVLIDTQGERVVFVRGEQMNDQEREREGAVATYRKGGGDIKTTSSL